MGNGQTKRHNKTCDTNVRINAANNAHALAMQQMNIEAQRIAARQKEAEIAAQREKERLAHEREQAKIKMEQEAKERRDELERQEMINKENDKEKKREQRENAINSINNKLDFVSATIDREQDRLKEAKEEYGDTEQNLEEIKSKLSNWDDYKNQELTVFKLNLDNARKKYERDENAINDAINATGVHEQSVGKFLAYTQSLIKATLATRASSNKLQIKISTFGELIQRLCQPKISIEGYFTDQQPKLQPFIQVLASKNITFLDDLKCKNEEEFDKEIIPLIEKGLLQQQQEQQEQQQSEENEEEKQDEKPEISFKELLTEWRLEKYIEKFGDEGWDEVETWNELTEEDLEDMGLKKGERKKFTRKYKKWSKSNCLDDDDELISFIQKRKLKEICLAPREWEKDAKQKVIVVRNELMIASPLLGGFFGQIDIAVKQAQLILEYPQQMNDENKSALSDTQRKAIKLVKDDEKDKDNKDESDNEIRQQWTKQSECKIYSATDKKWYDGTIMEVRKDNEGEWLTVSYTNDGKESMKVEIGRFAKEIQPKQEDKGLKPESNALIQASIMNFTIVESLRNECAGDSTKLQALNVADGVEQGCIQIFRSQGIIRQSVVLAQNILQFKPANMTDETRQKLWSAVDNGVIHIFGTAIEMVKVSQTYFSYFLKFKQSFAHFLRCYENKTEEEKENISLVVSMEYLQKDIREFDAFQKQFTKTIIELESNASDVITKCVKTAIGADEYEKSQSSREKTKAEYLEMQNQYDRKLEQLDKALDEFWDKKISLSGKFEKLKYETVMLKDSIGRNEKYQTELQERLAEIEKIQI